ncbi:MAG: hypothetical protein AAFU41_19010 [Pseudomonadota bacterium]
MAAADECVIVEDAAVTMPLRDQSFPLTAIDNVNLRAVDGKIRCEAAGAEMVCSFEGPGMLIVDAPGRPLLLISFAADGTGEARISNSGDVSCLVN